MINILLCGNRKVFDSRKYKLLYLYDEYFIYESWIYRYNRFTNRVLKQSR